jgi:hypothetical protein
MIPKTSNERTVIETAADDDLSSPPVPAAVQVDDLVRDYNAYAKKSSENVLGLASTILIVDDLGRRDREWFYAQVKLDPKGSTARKLRVIGQALPRFQPFLNVIPNTWTTLYELARLEDEDFKLVVNSGVLHPFVTLKEIDEARGRTSVKPSQEFRVYVDLNLIGSRSRQAEFVRKLQELAKEFELNPVAPSREEDLASLLDESDDSKQAA